MKDLLLSLFDPVAVTPTSPDDAPIQKEFQIEVNGESVPVRIILEHRLNNRATVNKNGIIIRVSERQNREEQRKQIDALLRWAREKLGDRPELLESLPQRQYVNGEVLKVGEQEFIISIFYNDLKKSTAKIFKNNIVLSLAKGLAADSQNETCSYLVAKCLCRFFQPVVTARIRELNDRYFKKQINGVKLKYATSYWGQCASGGQITISVRLMFAPASVIDYVLIHELAHLVHPNHSPNFWKVVEQIMPGYRNAEKHLAENNHKYFL